MSAAAPTIDGSWSEYVPMLWQALGETIYMVVEGDAVGDRYRVKKIGVDAVELEDVVTKAYRRIALR